MLTCIMAIKLWLLLYELLSWVFNFSRNSFIIRSLHRFKSILIVFFVCFFNDCQPVFFHVHVLLFILLFVPLLYPLLLTLLHVCYTLFSEYSVCWRIQDKVYLCLTASDSPGQDLTQYFSQCNDFIHRARLDGGSVLVHWSVSSCSSVMSLSSLRWHFMNKSSTVIGVSRPPVLDCGTTFHLDYGGRDLPSTPSDQLWKLIYLVTEVLCDSFEFIAVI